MRNITSQAVQAFTSGSEFRSGNTQVLYNGFGVDLYLFGNRIAECINGKLFISNRNYFTATTKERLNGLPGVRIEQRKGLWYLNGKRWDGSRVCIPENEPQNWYH